MGGSVVLAWASASLRLIVLFLVLVLPGSEENEKDYENDPALQERADVLAEAGRHLDGEAALAGHVEISAGGVILHRGLAVEGHAAGAGDDLHALGRAGTEVVAAGIDEPEGLLRAVGHQHGVADNLAVEVDVGLGVDGDAGELRGERHGGRLRAVPAGESTRPTAGSWAYAVRNSSHPAGDFRVFEEGFTCSWVSSYD